MAVALQERWVAPTPLFRTLVVCSALKASESMAPATGRCKDIECEHRGGDQRAHVTLQSLEQSVRFPPVDLDSLMGLRTEPLAGSEVVWATGLHRTSFRVSGRALPGRERAGWDDAD